jgi:hypothetical protein
VAASKIHAKFYLNFMDQCGFHVCIQTTVLGLASVALVFKSAFFVAVAHLVHSISKLKLTALLFAEKGKLKAIELGHTHDQNVH